MGDDTAVVASLAQSLLLTVDTVVEGVHADLNLVGIDDMGWRAVTTAVSDIAAMGGVADRLLISVSGPPSTDLGELYRGITEAVVFTAESNGASIDVVGGDLTTAPLVMISVSVIGHLPERTHIRGAALRSGAKPGDVLFLTGAVGAAAAGLRILRDREHHTDVGPPLGEADLDASTVRALVDAHRRPVARMAEGRASREAGATAMIDISDGIALDVCRIAVASGVGIRLRSVPIADGATEHEALCGGDDYELLFAANDFEEVTGVFAESGLRAPTAIGVCVEDVAEISLSGEPLVEGGWEHPWVITSLSDEPSD
jgi:thiamine-monophosphate kinase